METKFTKGKWELRDNNIDIKTKNKGLIVTCYRGGSYYLYEKIETEEAEANAKLISCCPIMFDYILKKSKEGDIEATKIIELAC